MFKEYKDIFILIVDRIKLIAFQIDKNKYIYIILMYTLFLSKQNDFTTKGYLLEITHHDLNHKSNDATSSFRMLITSDLAIYPLNKIKLF